MTPGGAGAGTVLVIGATGLIGSQTAERLEATGRPVIRASRSGRDADLACDLARPASVVAALESAAPEGVLLTAGISSVRAAWDEPAEAFEVNTGGTLHLLEAMRQTARTAHLLIASSGSVYGMPAAGQAEPFTEEDRLRPASPYAASKTAAEVLCAQYARGHGLAITTARIFNQLGPGQPASQAPSELAREIALAEARADSRVVLEVGNPGAERDYTDVRDTARALADLAERRAGGVFNVCSGATVSLASVVEGLAGQTSVEVRVEVNPDRAHPVDPAAVAGSNAKLVAETGWEPRIGPAESLRDLLEDWRRRV